ncbi:MAG TPA: hypothetical protein DD738_13350, partial [Ruminiclostridium sp.]|nr:hypothetical protein [Ruminiclostridium sp.]
DFHKNAVCLDIFIFQESFYRINPFSCSFSVNVLHGFNAFNKVADVPGTLSLAAKRFLIGPFSLVKSPCSTGNLILSMVKLWSVITKDFIRRQEPILFYHCTDLDKLTIRRYI